MTIVHSGAVDLEIRDLFGEELFFYLFGYISSRQQLFSWKSTTFPFLQTEDDESLHSLLLR